MDTFTTINAGSSTDEEKLTQLIDLLAQARVYMLEHFDAELPIDQLFSPYSEHEDHLRVAYEKVFIQQRMLARNNASVLQSEVDARIDRLEISGNHAEADVYELYTYTIQVGNSESGYYHSYIVVAHSGSSGSRTADNLWVAGHTEDMNYKHFSDVYSSSKYYRTIHITGSYR
jgi:hypothetical protein